MFVELQAEILAMHKWTGLMMFRNLKFLRLCLCLLVVFREQVKDNDPNLHM